MENIQNKKTFFIVLFLLILLTFFAILSIRNLLLNPIETITSVKPTQVPKATSIPKQGKFILKTSQNNNSYKINSLIIIKVYADSSVHDISGYDEVIDYDPEMLQFVGQKSLLNNFTLYPKKASGKIIITGAKKPGIKTANIFNNTPITELTFKAIKSGNTTLILDFTPGSTKDSNMIDTNNQEILGYVEGLRFTLIEK